MTNHEQQLLNVKVPVLMLIIILSSFVARANLRTFPVLSFKIPSSGTLAIVDSCNKRILRNNLELVFAGRRSPENVHSVNCQLP